MESTQVIASAEKRLVDIDADARKWLRENRPHSEGEVMDAMTSGTRLHLIELEACCLRLTLENESLREELAKFTRMYGVAINRAGIVLADIDSIEMEPIDLTEDTDFGEDVIEEVRRVPTEHDTEFAGMVSTFGRKMTKQEFMDKEGITEDDIANTEYMSINEAQRQ